MDASNAPGPLQSIVPYSPDHCARLHENCKSRHLTKGSKTALGHSSLEKDKKMNTLGYHASHVHMNHPILLPTLTALGILSLCSCVDPYYGGNYSYSGSATFSTLPHGYHTIYVGGTPYYYCDNRWYRRSGSHYIICPRPHGYHGSLGSSYHYRSVSRLPYGCRTTYVGGHRYYTHGNTWYRKSGSGYVTCQKPSGHSSHSHRGTHSSYKQHGDGKKHSPQPDRQPTIKPGQRTHDEHRRPGTSHRNRSSFLHDDSKQKPPQPALYEKRKARHLASSAPPPPKSHAKSPIVKERPLQVEQVQQRRPVNDKGSILTRHRSKFSGKRD